MMIILILSLFFAPLQAQESRPVVAVSTDAVIFPEEGARILRMNGSINEVDGELSDYVRERLLLFFDDFYEETQPNSQAATLQTETAPYAKQPWFPGVKTAATALLQVAPQKRDEVWLTAAEAWLRKFEQHLAVLPRAQNPAGLIEIELVVSRSQDVDDKRNGDRLGGTKPHYEAAGLNIKSRYTVSIDVKKLAAEATNPEQLMVWTHGVLDHEALHVLLDVGLMESCLRDHGFVATIPAMTAPLDDKQESPYQRNPQQMIRTAMSILADPPALMPGDFGPRHALNEFVVHAMGAARMYKLGLTKARRDAGLSYDSSVESSVQYATHYLRRTILPQMVTDSATGVMMSDGGFLVDAEMFKTMSADVDALLRAFEDWHATGSISGVVDQYYATMKRLLPPPHNREAADVDPSLSDW